MIDNQELDKIQIWEGGIVVPLTQNIVGGIACGAFGALLAFGWNEGNGLLTDWVATAQWSAILGGLVATGATVVRFFGDDFGLLSAAYRAGAASRNDEINNLYSQLAAWESVASQSGGIKLKEVGDRADLFKKWARDDALAMVKMHLSGTVPTLSKCKSVGIEQRRWERARRLLKSLKLMDEEGVTATSYTDASRAIEERFTLDQSRGSAYTPEYF